MPFLLAAAGGALGWAYVTRETDAEGEPETVMERITGNLGVALVASAAAVAVAWVWRRGR